MGSSEKLVSTTPNALDTRLRFATSAINPSRRAAQPKYPPKYSPSPAPRLFLVKGGSVSQSAGAGSGSAGKTVQRGSRETTTVITMPVRRNQRQDDLLLGSMAAFGPLVWIGHALLVWFKVA